MSASRYLIDPIVILRVAGTPLRELEALRFARTGGLLAAIQQLDGLLAAEGQQLSDQLHAVIGGQEDVALRRQLINLRRAVFQGVAPRPAWLTPGLWAALSPDLAGRLQAWLAAEARRRELEESGPAALGDDARAAYQELRRLSAQEPFQQGLLVANRELFAAARRWRAGGAAAEPERSLALGLTQYLSRSAAKTSPYSTFTSFAIGRWVDDGPAIAVCSPTSSRRSVLQLNRWVLNQIAGALLHWPELRPQLPVAENSSLVSAGGQLQFIAWRRGEAIIRVAETATLMRVLAELRRLPAPTYGALVAALAAVDGGDRRAAVASYIDQLIEVGLLHLDIGIPEQAGDYLAALAARLCAQRSPDVARVGGLLRSLHATLGQYAAAGLAAERSALLEEVGGLLGAVGEECQARGRAIELPAKHLFYEETTIPELEVRLSRAAWGAALDDLGLVRRLVGLLDPCLPLRIVAGARFAARFGPGASAPLLEAYAALQPEGAAPDWTAGASTSGLVTLEQLPTRPEPGPPALAALRHAQAQLLALLREHAWEQPALAVDTSALRALLDQLPAWMAPASTLACYVQALPGPLNRLVLNAVQSGQGRHRGRWERMLRQGGAPPDPSFAARPGPDEPIEADLAGVFTSTLSLRASPYAYEITYPGYVSDRPPEQQIPLQDLLVRHDEATGLLRLLSRRLGRELRPVHQSMLGEVWLPPLYRFLLRAFASGPVDPSPLSLTALVRPARLAQGLRADPRVTVGAVVVDRARWVVPAAELPVRGRAEERFAFLLRFQRWRASHSIPPTVFLRLLGDDKFRKPLYLDFASGLALPALERALGRADELLLFQEALPGAGELLRADGERGYVSEYVVEVGHAGGI